MEHAHLPRIGAVAAWRAAAREYAARGLSAEEVLWTREGEAAPAAADLFAPGMGAAPGTRMGAAPGFAEASADLFGGALPRRPAGAARRARRVPPVRTAAAEGRAQEHPEGRRRGPGRASPDAPPPDPARGGTGGGARPACAGDARAPQGATLPRDAIATIETALLHSDPQRFARAYGIVLRLLSGRLRWGDRADPALHRLLAQEKAVRRDIHKMHAFVRFRELGDPAAPRRAFAAWFEPEHPILEAAAPFFARRFGDMDWLIATPDLTARFEGGTLRIEETRDRTPPPEDAAEDLWRAYFASIFNPARLMVSAMTSEMPKKYWKNLPEADLIPQLIREAPSRARAMQAAAPTAPHPRAGKIRPSLAALRPQEGAAQDAPADLRAFKPALDACRRCPIGGCATQGVAGEGPGDAPLMIVGEQPGDAEDLAGRPLIGPAGVLFDACAAEAGLDRGAAYVTNAVKHFKFAPRGRRRLHRRPDAGEIAACRWWLEQEIALLRPRLILALGASAAEALTGSGGAIGARRGALERAMDGTPVLISGHPAHALRLSGAGATAEAEAARAALTADLARAAAMIAAPGSRAAG